MRQCHVEGAVEKELKSIIKKSGHYCIEGLLHVLPNSRDIVQQQSPFLLPSPAAMVTQHSTAAAAADTSSNDKAPLTKISASRKGKGTHGIRIVKALTRQRKLEKYFMQR